EGDTEYLVRTLNQFKTLDDMLQLSIDDRNGAVIRLKDIATVERTHKKRDVITRVDGQESVELLVHREAGANIVKLADQVRARLSGPANGAKLLADIRSGAKPDPEVELKAALLANAAKPVAAAAAPGTPGAEDPHIAQLRALVAQKRAALDCLKEKLPAGL